MRPLNLPKEGYDVSRVIANTSHLGPGLDFASLFYTPTLNAIKSDDGVVELNLPYKPNENPFAYPSLPPLTEQEEEPSDHRRNHQEPPQG